MVKHAPFLYLHLSNNNFLTHKAFFMKLFKSKICLVVAFSCNLVFSPIQSSDLSVGNIIDCCILSETPTVTFIKQTSAIIAALIFKQGVQYAVQNYLITEEFLVKSKYPAAQAWYEAIALKYPDAHLDKKLFLQSYRGFPAKFIEWCSTAHQIYCPQDALQEIELLYQKTIDGQKLTEEENVTLGMQEWVLLHEAGHIEHSDLTTRFFTSLGLIVGTCGAAALYKTYTNEDFHDSLIENLDNRLQRDTPMTPLDIKNYINKLIDAHNKKISKYEYWALTLALFNVSRHQERQADLFACELADTNALHGGILFFENELHDSLWNIETKELSPFIKTDSKIGTYLQSWAKAFDEKILELKKGFKSDRWMYDFLTTPTHPGPSVRAQSIRDEIQRRLDSQAQQPTA